ncbi:S-layer homology domain-containing protein [Lysinibacillus sp. NPDC058147]|uniref:S-layer homology domain-containing protein n=1 Tax=unclassified Lysinibacillus TaxID=2636778 RepID=UPI0036DD3D1E
MGSKMKLGMCSALLVSGLVYGTLGSSDLVANASGNNINTKVAQRVGSQFKDLNVNSYEAVNWARGKGIIQGYPDGIFKPNNPITEAQFAKMLVTFLGLKDDKGDLIKYTPKAMEYDTYYDALAAYGTPLNGYFDNNIRNKPVKRGVVASAIGHLTGDSISLSDSMTLLILCLRKELQQVKTRNMRGKIC